jgi:hypothetical protein
MRLLLSKRLWIMPSLPSSAFNTVNTNVAGMALVWIALKKEPDQSG